jgi:hypothetical protein
MGACLDTSSFNVSYSVLYVDGAGGEHDELNAE